MKKTEYTIKEAAKLLSKSDRSIRRYLDNLDKKKYCRLVKGRLFVNQKFIELCQSGQIGKGDFVHFGKVKKIIKEPIFEEKEEEKLTKEIEVLKEEKKSLFDIIQHKDKLLENKDELIKDNIQDLKILTSKVLQLQGTIQELQAPKKESPIEYKDQDYEKDKKEPSTANAKEGVLYFMLFLLIVLVALSIVSFLD